MRLASIVPALVISLAAPGPAAAAPPRTPDCPGASVEGVIAAVDGNGDIRLGSGQVLRLADVRLLGDGRGAQPAASTATAGGISWLRSLAGTPVRVDAGAPDRWDRRPALVEIAGSPGVDLAELLVSEGLAVVDAGEQDALCRPALLGAEAVARRRRLGAWRDATRPIAAGDRDGLGRATGRFEVVEGRIVSVGERSSVTYLNFGRDFARDLALVVPRRTWAALRRKGLSAASLVGRRVRARGVVEARRGPVIEIGVADMLELADEDQGHARP